MQAWWAGHVSERARTQIRAAVARPRPRAPDWGPRARCAWSFSLDSRRELDGNGNGNGNKEEEEKGELRSGRKI